MKVYGITKLGRRVASDSTSSGGEEMRTLDYLRNNRTATEDELEVVGGERWLMNRLVRQGLAKELTT